MGSLVIRNFRHGNKRSSLKLEAELWDALHELVEELDISENKLLSALADYKVKNSYGPGDGTFTSLVRVFIINCARKGADHFSKFRRPDNENLNLFLHVVFNGHVD